MNVINVSRAARVGLFFMFGVAMIWIVRETLSETGKRNERGYRIYASFSDVKQLKAGADVRLAGVSIGAVEQSSLKNGTAVVELSILPKYRIPNDSIAAITTAGLLGNNYISISLGASKENLKSGEYVNTKETADFNKVLDHLGKLGDKISEFLDGFDEKGGLFGDVNGLVHEMRPKIAKFLDNMVEVTDRIVEAEGTLGKLISEKAAYDQLLAAVDRVEKAAHNAQHLFGEAREMVAKFRDGKGPIHFLTRDDKAAEELRVSVANIRSFTEKLHSNENSLGKLMNDRDFYNRAENVMKKVESAVESMENNGPITAVGVAAGALF